MAEIVVNRQRINFELLRSELSLAFPGLVRSMVHQEDSGKLRVIVSSGTSQDDMAAILDKIEKHDETLKTPDQVARKNRDKTDLFTIFLDDASAWADAKSVDDFKRHMTRAFVELRMMVRGE